MNKIIKCETIIDAVGFKGVITGIWLYPTAEEVGEVRDMDTMIYTDAVWEVDKDRCMFEIKTKHDKYHMVYGSTSRILPVGEYGISINKL